MVLLNASSACVKSRLSQILSTVAALGAPSLNASGPMRVWTLSGVVIPGG